MVRRRSTVRFRKGAPQVRRVFRLPIRGPLPTQGEGLEFDSEEKAQGRAGVSLPDGCATVPAGRKISTITSAVAKLRRYCRVSADDEPWPAVSGWLRLSARHTSRGVVSLDSGCGWIPELLPSRHVDLARQAGGWRLSSDIPSPGCGLLSLTRDWGRISCPTAGEPSAGGASWNAKLTALRELVSQDRAGLAVQLASRQQLCVITIGIGNAARRAAGGPPRQSLPLTPGLRRRETSP
jgi:hypothetical protein